MPIKRDEIIEGLEDHIRTRSRRVQPFPAKAQWQDLTYRACARAAFTCSANVCTNGSTNMPRG